MLGLREKIGAVGVVSTAPFNYQRSQQAKTTKRDDMGKKAQNYTFLIDDREHSVIFNAPNGKLCPVCGETTNTTRLDGTCWECSLYVKYDKDKHPNMYGWAKRLLHHRAERMYASIGVDEEGKKWYLDENGEAMPNGGCFE